jgi:hypothetical protein
VAGTHIAHRAAMQAEGRRGLSICKICVLPRPFQDPSETPSKTLPRPSETCSQGREQHRPISGFARLRISDPRTIFARPANLGRAVRTSCPHHTTNNPIASPRFASSTANSGRATPAQVKSAECERNPLPAVFNDRKDPECLARQMPGGRSWPSPGTLPCGS